MQSSASLLTSALLCSWFIHVAEAKETDPQSAAGWFDDARPADVVMKPAAYTDSSGMQEGVWSWVIRLERSPGLMEKVPEKPVDEPHIESDAHVVQPGHLAGFDIPVRQEPEVQRWVDYFIGRGRRDFQRYLDRGGVYVPMMLEKLRAAEVPEDLIFLSLIESGFNPNAVSRAGAVGLWQFMPATARGYGMTVNDLVDDRRDPLKSTDAAIALLKDLHRMFGGDWMLAWCAYNAGPSRVRRGMKKVGTKDFFRLARKGGLPTETANYPPKLMAAAIVAKDFKKHGFTASTRKPWSVDSVKVDDAVSVEVLAELAKLSVSEFKELNPGLRRGATPSAGYVVHVKPGTGSAFSKALADLPEEKRLRTVEHVVKAGETLSEIAEKYGASTSAIMEFNRISNANRIQVGMRLRIPKHGDVAPIKAASKAAVPKSYTVKPGDTLSEIASRFGLETSDIVSWNRLPSASDIRVGQTLVLKPEPWKTVEVKSGDSLGLIAQRHGCSVEELRSWNAIKGDVIQPGQTLRIRR